MNLDLYTQNSYKLSELLTKEYSTSFSSATALLESDKRKSIYAIYGFVRLADEIVDSLHGFDKTFLFQNLQDKLQYALANGISNNLVVYAFTDTVKKYNIPFDHIDAFMSSMKKDLTVSSYTDKQQLNAYIYGSAEVVGLMCLKVFCNGNQILYESLEESARKLGSAFQKVNFIRDLKEDQKDLGRTYFPETMDQPFNKKSKLLIEKSIREDFSEARKGIRQLPGKSKLAVSLAYYYYLALFKRITHTSAQKVLTRRIRINNLIKYLIYVKVRLLFTFKLI